MRKLLVTILFMQGLTVASAQESAIRRMVDSLVYLEADTLDCSADLYWRIIAKREKAIPYLIEKLTDTTQTNIRFHCKKTPLNVAEVAQFALTEIADFPAYLVTRMQFDVIVIDESGAGCWSFYDFFFINKNKPRYQAAIRKWYAEQRSKYRPVKLPADKKTRCHAQFGITRYYRLKL
jgi:hypothetical protein